MRYQTLLALNLKLYRVKLRRTARKALSLMVVFLETMTFTNIRPFWNWMAEQSLSDFNDLLDLRKELSNE